MVFTEQYTDEQLIQILVELAVELGHTPRMKDLMKREGGPYPSLYQKRFSSGGNAQDGWNRALDMAGLGFNRKKPDQEGECKDCGVNGFTEKGHLIRWKGGDDITCMSCYQRRYYRENRKAQE
jgi:hypothetical protein